jgi:nickel-dependent lactate racemase
MKIGLNYGNEEISLNLPETCAIYKSEYKTIQKIASDMLFESILNPVGANTLNELLKHRKTGGVVIVVSDITRPIPYFEFLPQLLTSLEALMIKKNEITILVATGMHRASTTAEHLKMFGEYVVENYRIVNHDCENQDELMELKGFSWSGAKVRLNKHYVQAGFRIVTGLVEPHFMAGFSGGRKAICPGLVSFDAVQKFHGYTFLSHPNASSTILKDNPCHNENTSIAKMCPPDFSINVVLDNNKKINTIISGELFASHQKTMEYVMTACCPIVSKQADLVITSSGGYPLDATFYQCVKGFVNCLPAVKKQGEIISFGSCIEGIGSSEYIAVMKKYSGKYHQFIDDIKANLFFIKDQWQFQMHIRALEKVGQKNLHFYTSNIPLSELSQLSIHPHYVLSTQIERSIQKQIDQSLAEKKQISIFPEGPYCSPQFE